MRVSRQALRGRRRNRPDRSNLHRVIRLQWRDSFQDNGQISLKELGDDCIWESFGVVIRESDLFITIAFHHELTNPTEYADVLSVPWTQVISATVLDTMETPPALGKGKRRIRPEDAMPQVQPPTLAPIRRIEPLLPESESG